MLHEAHPRRKPLPRMGMTVAALTPLGPGCVSEPRRGQYQGRLPVREAAAYLIDGKMDSARTEHGARREDIRGGEE